MCCIYAMVMKSYPTLQFGLGALRGLYLIPRLLPSLRSMSKLSLKALHILKMHIKKNKDIRIVHAIASSLSPRSLDLTGLRTDLQQFGDGVRQHFAQAVITGPHHLSL